MNWPPERLARAILWRNPDPPGGEYFTLRETSAGWCLAGTVVLALAGRPACVRYAVDCDPAWETRTVDIAVHEGAAERGLRLAVDAERRWWLQGAEPRELPALAGCRDVDLGVTPSTNTLPIRRLGLAVGAAAPVTAAWVRFPDLAVVPLAQRYTHLAAGRWRYESFPSGFTADLDVDDLGLVVRYAGLWRREAG